MSKIKFEEGYIFKNNRNITSSPDIALTELVANAWDAGALNVEINLPQNENEAVISIKDDGCGLTDEEFTERWMTLNYDREKHQGKYVTFPEDVTVKNRQRVAYGRNGVGRHGMLCFDDQYTVETWKNGKGFRYVINVSSGDEPFEIQTKERISREGHGTFLSASINRNRPKIHEMKEILSARFIYDPQFLLKINGEELTLSSYGEDIIRKTIQTHDGVNLDITIVESSKTASMSKWHGVAFWVSGRLVGIPSWSYDKWQFLDARCKIAKRYTIIVQSNDIMDRVLPDWTGFYPSTKMNAVYEAVGNVIKELANDVLKEQVNDLKNDIIAEKRTTLEKLTLAEKRDVSAMIDVVTQKNPMAASEYLSVSIDALIQIQQAKRGTELLTQLSNMKPEEIDNLAELLKTWDINDVINVIDEIDRRILVIEAISRVCDNKETDELHTLHPMVLNAKWLFGAEFDSPMFISNSALNTVVKTLFKEDEYDVNMLANPRKRPDIVCLKRSTMRTVCTEKNDIEAGEIMKPDQILIIELKRGGFIIEDKEVMQATHYVRQIKKSGALHKNAAIHAFVVGAKIGDINTHNESESGIVDVVTYGHLVQTARAKLFGLKDKLEKHYNSIGDESLVEKALKQSEMDLFDT